MMLPMTRDFYGASPSRGDSADELSPRGRLLLQERLQTYAGVTALIALAYWPGFFLIWGTDPQFGVAAVGRHVASWTTVALLVVHGAHWMFHRVHPWTKRPLVTADVAAHTLLGVVYGQIMRSHPSPTVSVLEGLLALTSVLMVRALLVPSSAGRTALVGVLACAGAGAAVAAAPARFASAAIGARSLGALFVNWAAIAIVLSAVASRVLYGLRRQVREARKLGQYTLLEKLGEGGMGVVYRAQHALLRRPTAIKLLPPKHRNVNVARFEREVQLMAELTHPNTVAVHDYGRTEDGIFYYVMEHLDGVDLDGLVAVGGAQPLARVLHILQQVCGSLDEAHRRGLIHRDIKPANVFLCRDRSEADTVKVLDFGLAKDNAAARIGAVSATQTAAHTLIGTPLYMAPESLVSAPTLDARADLYALGAVGYFLLTGTPVFAGGTAVEVGTRHLVEAPQTPSARLGRPVPAAVEAMLLACLAKDPDLRPTDARSLAATIRACAAGLEWSRADADTWWAEHGARVEAHRKARASRVRSEDQSLFVRPTHSLSG